MSEQPEVENIVVVALDSLRASSMDIYESSGASTPFLKSKISSGGKGNHYSNASWTIPAHASMFSEKLPSEHGTNTKDIVFTDKNRLANYFNEKDYDTALITENALLSPETGFSESFDIYRNADRRSGKTWIEVWEKDQEFESRFEKYSYFLRNATLRKDLVSFKSLVSYILEKFGLDSSEDYNPTYSDWTLEEFSSFIENTDSNFFAFVNLMATHYPYTFNESQKADYLPDMSREEIEYLTSHGEFSDFLDKHGELSDEELNKLRQAYEASITYVDSLLEAMYKATPENTAFIVVGDHGEIIGEKEIEDVQIVDHHFGTFENLLKVPLVCFPFGGSLDGISSHTEILDIAKSIHKGEPVELSKDRVIAEYYGRREFNDNFGIDIPKGLEALYSRKSFSIIRENRKLDLASDGEKLWKLGSYEDEEIKDEELKEELKDKIPFVLNSILQDEHLI